MPASTVIGQQLQPMHFVRNQNEPHQAVVWVKSKNPYCSAMKKLLSSLTDLDVVIKEVDEYPNRELIEHELQEMTGSSSFPYFFANNRYVGGYRDIQQAHRNNTLRQLLQTPPSIESKASSINKGSSAKSFTGNENSAWSKNISLESRAPLFQEFVPGLRLAMCSLPRKNSPKCKRHNRAASLSSKKSISDILESAAALQLSPVSV